MLASVALTPPLSMPVIAFLTVFFTHAGRSFVIVTPAIVQSSRPVTPVSGAFTRCVLHVAPGLEQTRRVHDAEDEQQEYEHDDGELHQRLTTLPDTATA